MNTKVRSRLLFALFLVVLATVMRIVPHPWNLTPVGAVALFSGACFDRRKWAFAIPLLAMLAGDTIAELTTGYGYHSLMPVIYATFAAIVGIGLFIRERRSSPAAVAAAAFASATLFFVVSNFAMWTISTIYPKTLGGLVACYIAGIPFFGNQVAGDLLYSFLLFGTFVWGERRIPKFSPTEAA